MKFEFSKIFSISMLDSRSLTFCVVPVAHRPIFWIASKSPHCMLRSAALSITNGTRPRSTTLIRLCCGCGWHDSRPDHKSPTNPVFSDSSEATWCQSRQSGCWRNWAITIHTGQASAQRGRLPANAALSARHGGWRELAYYLDTDLQSRTNRYAA